MKLKIHKSPNIGNSEWCFGGVMEDRILVVCIRWLVASSILYFVTRNTLCCYGGGCFLIYSFISYQILTRRRARGSLSGQKFNFIKKLNFLFRKVVSRNPEP